MELYFRVIIKFYLEEIVIPWLYPNPQSTTVSTIISCISTVQIAGFKVESTPDNSRGMSLFADLLREYTPANTILVVFLV
jgi:hypothetical protein